MPADPRGTGASVEAVVIGGFEHGDDVLGGNFGLHVVDLAEDESSAGREVYDAALHLLLDLLHGAPAEDMLGVATPSPEGYVAPEVALQARRFHARGRDLHGVEGIHADLDEIGDCPTHGAAGVQQQRAPAARFEVSEETLLVGLDALAVEVRGEHRPRLGAEVVVDEDDVHRVAEGGKELVGALAVGVHELG